MNRARVLLIVACIGLTYSTPTRADDAPDRCGGVLMAPKSQGGIKIKDLVQKNGFYAADGGLVDKDGKSTCTSIRIECFKQTNSCRTATASTTSGPQVIGVTMSDNYTVLEWTKDVIYAELRLQPRGGSSQLQIQLSDKGPDTINVVNAWPSIISGKWETEVLTVEDDPVIDAIRKKAKLAPPCKNGSQTCEPWERDWGDTQLQPGATVTNRGVVVPSPAPEGQDKK